MKKALVLLIIIISVFTVSPAFAAAKEHKVLDVTFTVSDEYNVYTKENVSPQNVINGFEFAAYNCAIGIIDETGYQNARFMVWIEYEENIVFFYLVSIWNLWYNESHLFFI